MSFRAGPVRNNRRQVRQKPYSRPTRAGYASSQPQQQQQQPQQQQPSLFSRIKQFFWGAPASKSESPRISEPPRLLGEDESELLQENENEASQFADIDSDTSTGSRIIHTSQSFTSAPEPTPAVTDGPNEALRQFFDTKGDEELSNMEVVGVLSLIGQAVSRNESLVDFSQLSMDQQTDNDVTASDGSVLKGLHVPPSPQLYRQGTPPPSNTRRAVDRSPWNSTPRRSSIRSRYSLAAEPPRGSPAIAARSPRPSGLRNSIARNDSGPASTYARTEQPRVTPAASAILEALDSESSPRRVLTSQRPSRIPNRDVSDATDANASGFNFSSPTQTSNQTPSVSTPKPFNSVPASLLGSKSRDTKFGGDTKLSDETKLSGETGSSQTKVSDTAFTNTKFDNSKVGSTQFGETKSNENTFGQTKPSEAKFNFANKPAESVSDRNGQISKPQSNVPNATEESDSDAAFAFEIPVSTAPRELTPAEEAIVAETQSEFIF